MWFIGCIALWQEVQRNKAEQIEKARLRHKHALAQLQLEEVRSSEHLLVLVLVNKVEAHYFTNTGANNIICSIKDFILQRFVKWRSNLKHGYLEFLAILSLNWNCLPYMLVKYMLHHQRDSDENLPLVMMTYHVFSPSAYLTVYWRCMGRTYMFILH